MNKTHDRLLTDAMLAYKQEKKLRLKWYMLSVHDRIEVNRINNVLKVVAFLLAFTIFMVMFATV